MPDDNGFDPTAAVIDAGAPPEVEVRPGDVPGVTVDVSATQVRPGLSKEPAKTGPTNDDLMAELREQRRVNESLTKQVNAGRRVTEDLRRQMDEVRRGVAVPKAPVPTSTSNPLPDDDQTRLAELRPWEKPLRTLMREEAEKVAQEREAVRQKEAEETGRRTELERSQQFVISKYPALSDDESEVTELYLSVVNSHPEWHRDPFGPTRAMLEMERIAQEQGIQLSQAQKAAAPRPNTEIARRTRAAAGALPPGRTIASGTKVTLTREQEDFAKTHRIPVETYAKMVSGLNHNGGVEAQ